MIKQILIFDKDNPSKYKKEFDELNERLIRYGEKNPLSKSYPGPVWKSNHHF